VAEETVYILRSFRTGGVTRLLAHPSIAGKSRGGTPSCRARCGVGVIDFASDR
jgi:hypothetical protein